MADTVKKLQYETKDSYSLRMMQSIEYVICYEAKQHRIAGYDVEDVAQELRLHLWRRIEQYDPSKANFKTWSMQVIHNKIIDLHDLRSDCLHPTNHAMISSVDEYADL